MQKTLQYAKTIAIILCKRMYGITTSNIEVPFGLWGHTCISESICLSLSQNTLPYVATHKKLPRTAVSADEDLVNVVEAALMHLPLHLSHWLNAIVPGLPVALSSDCHGV